MVSETRFERWRERHLIVVITGMPPLDPAGHGALARQAAGQRRW